VGGRLLAQIRIDSLPKTGFKLSHVPLRCTVSSRLADNPPYYYRKNYIPSRDYKKMQENASHNYGFLLFSELKFLLFYQRYNGRLRHIE